MPSDNDDVRSVIGDDEWILVSGSLDGEVMTLAPDAPVTLALTDTGIGGVSSCNSYGGGIVGDGGPLFPELFGTLMACVDPVVSELESASMAALSRVTGVALEDGQLVLSGEGAEMRFEPAPKARSVALEETLWLLQGVVDVDVITSPSAEAKLSFGRGQIEGTSGCNNFGGTISINGSLLEVPLIEITEMGCEPAIMEQENAILNVLTSQPTWRIDGDLLIIELEGAGLIYRAAP